MQHALHALHARSLLRRLASGGASRLGARRGFGGGGGGVSGGGGGGGGGGSAGASGGLLEGRHVETFDEGCEVWRCEWNVLGTVLAAQSEGGALRLRRADLAGRWAVVADLSTPDSAADAAGGVEPAAARAEAVRGAR